MKKLFFLILLIVGFLFLFNFRVSYVKGCDDLSGLKCGGWAKCDKTATQSGCLADCSAAQGYGDWAYPYCNCKSKPGVSECKCKCEEGDTADLTDGCVGHFCTASGLGIGGKCLSETTYRCCTATEDSCQDGIDNDCDGLTDCADTTDCPDGTSCGLNKECKASSCVVKVLPTPTCSFTNCEDKHLLDCLCGTTKIFSGMYCCAPLNTGYTLQTDCQAKCPVCNNNKKEVGEVCDGTDLDGKTCIALGYTGGTLTCKPDCTFDTSGCTGVPVPPTGGPGSPKVVCPSATCTPGTICIQNPLCAQTFEELIDAIVDFLFWIGIAISPLMVVIAAYYLTTAGGDPKKIETAKNIIFYTLIGLLIILLAKALIAAIEGVL